MKWNWHNTPKNSPQSYWIESQLLQDLNEEAKYISWENFFMVDPIVFTSSFETSIRNMGDFIIKQGYTRDSHEGKVLLNFFILRLAWMVGLFEWISYLNLKYLDHIETQAESELSSLWQSEVSLCEAWWIQKDKSFHHHIMRWVSQQVSRIKSS